MTGLWGRKAQTTMGEVRLDEGKSNGLQPASRATPTIWLQSAVVAIKISLHAVLV
jgi:hypothetical protein